MCRHESRNAVVFFYDPNGSHHRISAVGALQWPLDDVAYPVSRRHTVSNLLTEGMVSQRVRKLLPLISPEAKSPKEEGFAPAIGMVRIKQVLENL